MSKELVAQRGHLVPKHYPFVLEEKLEAINKTKELLWALQKLGFKDELSRADTSKIRAGKGKLRGRRKTETTIKIINIKTMTSQKKKKMKRNSLSSSIFF